MVLNVDICVKWFIINQLGRVVLGGFEKGVIFSHCGPQAVASPCPAERNTTMSNPLGSEKYWNKMIF